MPSAASPSVFWNFLTAAAVSGPYWPSDGTRKPSRERFSCSVSTSGPFMPARRVRCPNLAAFAPRAVGAAVPSASRATAAIIQILVVRAFHARRAVTARTPVLFRAPTGLAVGLARKESRYGLAPALLRRCRPIRPRDGPRHLAWSPPWFPRSPTVRRPEIRLWDVRQRGNIASEQALWIVTDGTRPGFRAAPRRLR